MTIEAMKQMVEALEAYQHNGSVQLFDEAITTGRQAIAEAEQLDKLLVHQPMLDLWQRYCDKKQEVDDLKEKLAEAEKHEVYQEPHGYLKLSNAKFYYEVEGVPNIDNNPEFLALYTHQQPKAEQEPVAWAERAAEWLLDLPNTRYDAPYFTNGMFKGDCLELADLLQKLTHPQPKREPVDHIEQARKGCGNCSYQYCDYPDCVKRKTK